MAQPPQTTPQSAVAPLQRRARVAVIVPCYNEEVAVGTVVRDFRAALPEAIVYVYDNNSRDRTIEVAREAGAVVRREPIQGKGAVVRRALADVDADVYLLVDGDATYDASAAPAMVQQLLDEQLDMVTGVRITDVKDAYRPGHRFGNFALTFIVRAIFGNRISDMLSGYRAFSRRFVKSFPANSRGFETETEFTIHALELSLPIAEVNTRYRERPPGSVSKLRTYTDGALILRTILLLIKEQRPLAFFSTLGAIGLVLGVGLGIPVVREFAQTGLVPRFPTAILATGIVLSAFLSFAAGLILDSVARGRKDAKRLVYLSIPPAGSAD